MHIPTSPTPNLVYCRELLPWRNSIREERTTLYKIRSRINWYIQPYQIDSRTHSRVFFILQAIFENTFSSLSSLLAAMVNKDVSCLWHAWCAPAFMPTHRWGPASVLQCVAVCCSMLQYVAACYNMLQCVAIWCRALQHVAAFCSMLQHFAACCSRKRVPLPSYQHTNVLQCVAPCCSVLQ